MFYRKYFEGNGDDTTITLVSSNYCLLPNSMDDRGKSLIDTGYVLVRQKDMPWRLKIITDAITSTLRDCGIDAINYFKYETAEDEGIPYYTNYLYLDYNKSNIGIYFRLHAYSDYINYQYFGRAIGNRTGNPSYANYIDTGNHVSLNGGNYNNYTYYDIDRFEFFESNNSNHYKFYVTIKGEPTGFYSVYIGTYASPDSMNHIFSVYNLYDPINDADMYGVQVSNTYSNRPIMLYADDLGLISIDYNSSTDTPGSTTYTNSSWTDVNAITSKENKIILMDAYTNKYAIKMKNSYIKNDSMASDTFYDIDGEIYYVINNSITKCTTQVIPTEDNNG